MTWAPVILIEGKEKNIGTEELVLINNCIVPKNLTLNTFKQLMDYGRLTEKKVRYIVRHKRRGKSNREIAFEMRVSVSTVKRVWSYWITYREYLPIRKRGR